MMEVSEKEENTTLSRNAPEGRNNPAALLTKMPEESQTCIICYSNDILELKCKIICQNCGYKRDCSDP